ncbi:MAG: 6,7-dimethyl-8-ribityllumazine synthase [Phycisphaerales bacterium]|nr:6,7-dimethyl-8-ribityllumazine synthase [Planctomycetota bacterium]MCH8508923.1 6,7-dimethyl-8-ribityllumazine synthase [Phycisphaerales bacterium]
MARPVHPVAILVSRYNESVTGAMLAGAVEAYAERGGDPAGLTIVEAPGAYELVALANAAADRHKAVVCLGCVIKGETPHDEHIARAVAHGLAEITVKTGVPVAFGVLTTLDAAQAKARAAGRKGNKGAEAMHAALDAAEGVAALRHGAMPVRVVVNLPVPDKAADRAAGQTALRGG